MKDAEPKPDACIHEYTACCSPADAFAWVLTITSLVLSDHLEPRCLAAAIEHWLAVSRAT